MSVSNRLETNRESNFSVQAEVTNNSSSQGSEPINSGVSGPLKKLQGAVHKVLQLFSRDDKGNIVQGSKIMAHRDWIEFFDPEHQRPRFVKEQYLEWVSTPQLKAQMSFYEYRDHVKNTHPGHPLHTQQKVRYFTPEERAQYVVSIEPDSLGQARILSHGNLLVDGKYLVVLGPDEKVYAAKEVQGQLHHSSFFAGKSVFGAGEFLIINGVLKEFAALSGHYLPGLRENTKLLNYLRNLGVNLQTFVFMDYDQGKAEKHQQKLARKKPEQISFGRA